MIQDLEVVNGAEAGSWIAPRLEGGFGGQVKQQVPNGYDAYVRVFHPVSDGRGNSITWAKVAETLGRTAHREMQWHRLIDADDFDDMTSSEWSKGSPSRGELDEVTLKALCGVLQAHTRDPDRCFFGLSTIHGGVEHTYPKAILLRWHDRDFVIFSGPLSAADQLGYKSIGGWIVSFPSNSPGESLNPHRDHDRWWSQAPNLIWPADRSWYVASEYDLDSTLVGCSRDLADAILAAPELEVWEVERGDSLEADADKIN
jgi:hypothetical protein